MTAFWFGFCWMLAGILVLWCGHRLELHLHDLDRPLNQRGEGGKVRAINQLHNGGNAR